MSLPIKHSGQGVTPKAGLGMTMAMQARRAVCNCGGKTIDQRHVFDGAPVPVTIRKRRAATSVAA